jgi:hypothetical protein
VKKHYFDPETQALFWENLSPDIRVFLDALEQKETWTYQVNEFESLFLNMANALPKIIQLPLSEEHQTIVYQLIPILVSMPLRQCISAVAYLDKYGATDANPVGWGVLCFIEAKNVDDNVTDEFKLSCETFCARINTFIRSSISTELFENIKVEDV